MGKNMFLKVFLNDARERQIFSGFIYWVPIIGPWVLIVLSASLELVV